MGALRVLAATQDGVVTTAQCLDLGIPASTMDRRVRSGSWQRLHRGVLLIHSGPIGWRSRAHAALLWAGTGAVLSHAAAGFLHELVQTPPRLIDVSVPHGRRVMPTLGLRVHPRRVPLIGVGRPLRTSRIETLVDLLADAESTDRAIGLLTDAVRAGVGVTDVAELLDRRPNMRRHALVRELIGAVRAGIESPMELRFHRRVERRHHLPTATLQVRAVVDGRLTRADALYEGQCVRVELDGIVAHAGRRGMTTCGGTPPS